MSLVPDHDLCRVGSHVYTVLVARWALRYTILLRTGYPIDRYPIHGAGALAYGEFPNRQAHYVMNDRWLASVCLECLCSLHPFTLGEFHLASSIEFSDLLTIF